MFVEFWNTIIAQRGFAQRGMGASPSFFSGVGYQRPILPQTIHPNITTNKKINQSQRKLYTNKILTNARLIISRDKIDRT